MQINKYRGLLLDETLNDGRASGEIFIQNRTLFFEGEGMQKSMSLASLSISHGGTSKRQIYFQTAGESFTICSLDAEILKEEALKSQEKLQPNISKIKSHRNWFKVGLVSLSLIIVLPILSLLLFKNQIIHSIANQVPTSLEKGMGESYLKQVALMETLDSSSAAVQELRKKAQLIANQTDGKHEFTIYISNSDQVNAYALPGGYVVFNKGLLDKAKNWEEVLGVMGHEMAHVTQRHHARGVLSQLGWTTVLSFVLGDGGAMTDILFASASKLESLSYSRSFETESDEKGFEYLQKANISPKGLISFFETLEKEAGAAKHIPEMLSTHPASDNRANNLQEKLDKEGKKEYLQLEDYQEFIKLLNNK